ncbi:MAG: thioredoxin [Candidatus Methanofastidiosa archaeon]|nr:thioredoxin [Candidatus Methanofastidiosa archaeon]
MDEVDDIKKRKMEEMLKANAAPAEPIHATDENFDQLLKDNSLLLVDFWAEWCMPCKMFAPTIVALAKEMQGTVAVAKLNVDESRATATRYNTMSIPTTILFKNGQPVDKMVGAVPKERLADMVKRYL